MVRAFRYRSPLMRNALELPRTEIAWTFHEHDSDPFFFLRLFRSFGDGVLPLLSASTHLPWQVFFLVTPHSLAHVSLVAPADDAHRLRTRVYTMHVASGVLP